MERPTETRREGDLSIEDVDVDSRAAIASAIAIGTLGVLSFIVQPGLVQGFVSELEVSEAAANDLAFREMLGVALATIALAFASRHINLRRTVAAGLALAAVGNLASAFLADGAGFSLARFLTGVGEGIAISISFSVVGVTQRASRNLALYLATLLTYGAVGLWAMPWAFETIGLSGVFLFWAAVLAVGVIAAKHTPRRIDDGIEARATALNLTPPAKATALGGVLIYNIAIGVAWANLFLIGMEIVGAPQPVANALLASQFVAIGGALTALFFDKPPLRLPAIFAGIFGGAAAIALLLGSPTFSAFLLAVCAFNYLWNMALPFILSAVGDMDPKGRLMSAAIAMQMIGLGFGPFVAARLLGETDSFAAVEKLTIGLLVVSAAVMAGPLFIHRAKLRERTVAAPLASEPAAREA
ncbi:MAG: MFS transporter [Pseudomonadota bacterium]